MTLYPKPLKRRLLWIAADGVSVLLAVLGGGLAIALYRAVEYLRRVPGALAAAGRALVALLAGLRDQVPSWLGVIGVDITGWLARAEQIVQGELVEPALQAQAAIGWLALWTAFSTALPFLLVVAGYWTLRLRGAREMSATRAFIRRAETAGQAGHLKQVLAERAVATVPMRVLRRVSRDPLADLETHQYDALARLMYRRAGLEPWSTRTDPELVFRELA